MDFETRRKYFNMCKPSEPLEPSDGRNVDIDNIAPDDENVRGEVWAKTLGDKIVLSDEPVCELFTGLPGTGKSTELRRLAERLSTMFELLPVIVSAEDILDLTAPIDVPDIIAGLIDQTEREVLRLEGKNSEDALKDGYVTRLWTWLTNTDISLKGAELTVGTKGKLVVEMKTRPALRDRIREIVAANLNSFLHDAREEFRKLEARAIARGRKGIVVVLDSLERLQGISTNWNEVLGSAERLFANGAPYLRLPVHAIYTVPPALIARHFKHITFLPMIKLVTREGVRSNYGWKAAREIVRRRVPDEVLSQQLGPGFEQRVEQLIGWSGGYPREIIRLLQAVLQVEHAPVADHAFQRMLNSVSDAYRNIVPAEAFPWLARVHVDKYFTPDNEENRRDADRMISNNVILRYMNTEAWFDLHPAVLEIPGIQEAVKALRAHKSDVS